MPPTVTGTVLDGIISGVLEDLHERQLMVTSDNLREATELVAPAIDPIPRLTAPGLSVISEIKRSSPSNGQLAAFMTLPHWLISTAPVEPLLSAF